MNDEIIYAYTRADAIADGVLLDVSAFAKEAGFCFPVAVTSGVWAEAVEVHSEDVGQDETGRLWDVLNVLRYACRTANSDIVHFQVAVRRGKRTETVPLKAHIGPGDDFAPVITIMLPNED